MRTYSPAGMSAPTLYIPASNPTSLGSGSVVVDGGSVVEVVLWVVVEVVVWVVAEVVVWVVPVVLATVAPVVVVVLSPPLLTPLMTAITTKNPTMMISAFTNLPRLLHHAPITPPAI